MGEGQGRPLRVTEVAGEERTETGGWCHEAGTWELMKRAGGRGGQHRS